MIEGHVAWPEQPHLFFEIVMSSLKQFHLAVFFAVDILPAMVLKWNLNLFKQ